MSQSTKAGYYNALKEAGVEFDRHYREYTTDELKAAYLRLTDGQDLLAPQEAVATPQSPPSAPAGPRGDKGDPGPQPRPQAPRRERDPNEMAGQRLNTNPDEEVIRVDEKGRMWIQEEVRKPAFPKPRGRRVLTYMETGTKTQQAVNGEYVESFEVSGDGPARPAEVKITLPSHQVGIYRDKRFPFRIHIYNDVQGFDLFEVQNYYGGEELVPESIKRMYVANVLCYDIRTTIRTIQQEYRRQQLTGKA